MKTRNRLFIAQCFVLLLSCAWMSSAQAQKVVVSEAIPNSAEQGTTLNVDIKGRGFQNGANVAFWRTGTTNPGGVTVNAVTVHDSKNLTANIDVDDLADIDLFDIEVMNTNGRKGKGITLFSVKLKGGGPTADTTPPSLITDFESFLPTSNLIRLSWMHSGDDGDEGYADHYVLLQAAQANESDCDGSGSYDFSNAVPLDPPDPRSHGGSGGHEFWAEGLNAQTCYAFSIEPFDEAGNSPGPAFTANVTQAAPPAGAWDNDVELVSPSAYGKYLEFDPASGEPVVLGERPNQNHHYWRTPGGSWSYQKAAKKSGSGSVAFGYDETTGRFGGVIQNSRNIPSYIELQADGSWDTIQITRDRVRIGGQALAFDSNGPTIAYRHLDGFIQVASYNGSSFDIETPPIPAGWEPHVQFDPSTTPAQLKVVYASDDKQDIIIATKDSSGWSFESVTLGQNIGSDIQTAVFMYDSNDEPIIIFGEALDTFWEYWAHMLRPDSSGDWVAGNEMMIDPFGHLNQNANDMAIASNGTLYLTMSSTAGQARVGRFCEDHPNNSCSPTRDSSGANVWLWETAGESIAGGGTISIAIKEANGVVDTVAIITDGPEHNSTTAETFMYMRCNPLSDSVICGSPPAP